MIKLDVTKLLGFRLAALGSAKIGTKPGTKLGAKLGAKPGAKFGAKFGLLPGSAG